MVKMHRLLGYYNYKTAKNVQENVVGTSFLTDVQNVYHRPERMHSDDIVKLCGK